MLGNATTVTTIPVVDLARALDFYTNTLGLRLFREEQGGTSLSGATDGSILLYERGVTTADHTVCSFEITDIDGAVADLRKKGVTFHDYDFPGLKTVDGIASMDDNRKAAWFNDTEGNILSIGNMG